MFWNRLITATEYEEVLCIGLLLSDEKYSTKAT